MGDRRDPSEGTLPAFGYDSWSEGGLDGMQFNTGDIVALAYLTNKFISIENRYLTKPITPTGGF